MKINFVIFALVIVAFVAFFYFVIKRNKKDQKKLESELNQEEIKPDHHDENHI